LPLFQLFAVPSSLAISSPSSRRTLLCRCGRAPTSCCLSSAWWLLVGICLALTASLSQSRLRTCSASAGRAETRPFPRHLPFPRHPHRCPAAQPRSACRAISRRRPGAWSEKRRRQNYSVFRYGVMSEFLGVVSMDFVLFRWARRCFFTSVFPIFVFTSLLIPNFS
jgi:hypothetical protein